MCYYPKRQETNEGKKGMKKNRNNLHLRNFQKLCKLLNWFVCLEGAPIVDKVDVELSEERNMHM